MQGTAVKMMAEHQENSPPDDLGALLPELLAVGEGAWSGLAPARPIPRMASKATPPAAKYGVGSPPPAVKQ